MHTECQILRYLFFVCVMIAVKISNQMGPSKSRRFLAQPKLINVQAELLQMNNNWQCA